MSGTSYHRTSWKHRQPTRSRTGWIDTGKIWALKADSYIAHHPQVTSKSNIIPGDSSYLMIMSQHLSTQLTKWNGKHLLTKHQPNVPICCCRCTCIETNKHWEICPKYTVNYAKAIQLVNNNSLQSTGCSKTKITRKAWKNEARGRNIKCKLSLNLINTKYYRKKHTNSSKQNMRP